MTNRVRVRLGPSPTGDVHIGSIWIAHFNWIFARQQKGDFILRLEDTDQKRLVPGSIEKIYEALDWYGLTPSEGPRQGGEHGPYVQSERLPLYRQYAEQLLEQGSAYYCFCSAERLEQLRSDQQAAKLPPRYDKKCASGSLTEAQERIARGEKPVIRINMPATGQVSFTDLIRGQVTFAYDQIDDSVILKSDGFPTYHLAVVVDDHLMEISHVFRAEEWLPSTPKHLFLYERLGWVPPQFAHFPQILGADKKKLSKRQGATSALAFRDQGYLPEAMRNFLALMGWHPKGDKEILTAEDIIQQFRLEEVNPSGAIFDQTKLDWMNGAYIRQMPLPELRHRLEPWWHLPADEGQDKGWQHQVIQIVRDRMKTLADIDELTSFFFASKWNEAVKDFDPALLIPKKGTQADVQLALTWSNEALRNFSGAWEAPMLKEAIISAIAQENYTNAQILWPLRVTLSLRGASPDVFDLLATLGREESERRIQHLLEKNH